MKMFTKASDRHIVGRSTRKSRKALWSVAAFTLCIALVVVVVGCPDDAGDTATFKYTCDNGIAKTGNPSGSSNVVACASCSTGFKLMGEAGAVNTTCVKETAVVYTCENGTAKSGTPSGSSNVVACASCSTGFKLMGEAGAVNTTCVKETAVVYTCENGTAKSGTPSGSSDVVACQTCNSGFKLMGTAGVDGTTCVQDSTAPTFTAGPALKAGSTGATSVTVTLTASEVGKVFWVAYAATAAAPADATALIDDATRDTAPSTVVARSATATVVDSSTDAVEIALTGLTKSTNYNFYAVLQDAAQNISALSPKLEITTAGTPKYTCDNGTARTGTPGGTADVVACQTCSTGFTLKGTPGADNTTCVEETTTARYTCDNGIAKTGTPSGTADVVACQSCNPGFKLTAPSGGAIGENGTTCAEDTTPPTFSAAPMVSGTPSDTSATVTLTASEAGKLFWVLYADNAPAPATAAALIKDATSDNAGEHRSGDGVAVDAATQEAVILTGLTASTSYDFYAVVQDSAGNTSDLSAKLDVTTTSAPDNTAPTFSAGPALNPGSVTDTDAEITLTASEAGKLFWVLYAGGATPPGDAVALIKDATSDNAGEKRSGDSVTVTSTEATVALTALTAATSYDFYAVLQDGAANTGDLSTKLDITTAAIYTCTDGMPKAGTPSGNANVEACQSCQNGFKLNGSPGADNTTCVATQYTCPATGTAKTGSPSGNADVLACQSCSSGFKLTGTPGADNTTCVATEYTCPDNGTAKTGSPSGTADQVVCERCNDGFKLAAPDGGTIGENGTTCVATKYTCSNGAVQTGAPTTGNTDVESCISCDSGYALTDTTPKTCALDTDGDNVPDTQDSCPTGVTGWTSNSDTDKNSDGCRDSAITAATTIGNGDVGIALSSGDLFGYSLASLGDLSGDGIGITVAVGASWDDAGGSNRGALYLLNLNDKGSLSKLLTKIDSTTKSNTLSLDNNAYFGTSAVSLGDLDGSDGVGGINGARTVAVGSGIYILGGGDGVVRLLTLDQTGDILKVVTIDESTTLVGTTTTLGLVTRRNLFGTSLANLGDLDGNGDGVLTLLVGDIFGNSLDRKGALYLLNLNASGGILSSTRIADSFRVGTTFTFKALQDDDGFGRSVANLGDLDGTGSGATTVAVGAWGDDAGGTDRGALYLLNLDSSGGIVGVSKIDDTTTLADSTTDAFTLANDDEFGISVANLGDLDGSGSGATTVAVGAWGDDAGGTGRGALYLLNLDSSGGIVGVSKIDDTATLTNGTTDAFTLANSNWFGSSVTGVDYNTDAALDALLVGAIGAGGGAVHVLHLGEIDW